MSVADLGGDGVKAAASPLYHSQFPRCVNLRDVYILSPDIRTGRVESPIEVLVASYPANFFQI